MCFMVLFSVIVHQAHLFSLRWLANFYLIFPNFVSLVHEIEIAEA